MRTPVNVITGVLGAGKTTFITSLLANAKPADETWAVVVNDFGALGIDGALFDDAVGGGGSGTKAGEATDDKIIVRQVSGGCACCATAAPFTLYHLLANQTHAVKIERTWQHQPVSAKYGPVPIVAEA